MAIYSLNLGFISRSEGRSSVGFSAYISGGRQQDARTGVMYNYGCKEDVIVSRVLAPEGAPEWAKSSSTLWNVVEQFEDDIATLRFRGYPNNPDKNQKSLEGKERFLNSTQTAQTIMGAIPIEFSQMEAEACVEAFLNERFVSRGLVVEYAIHWDKGNPHFHGMITRRALEDDEFAQRKDREIVTKPELLVTRKLWETVVNKHLELGGYEVRIDSRSYADQGLDLIPSHHEGWYAQRLAERGEYSRIVTDNEAIRQKNIEILCKNPAVLVQEVALKRTVFTRRHLEEEIMRRVGGDDKLFSLLKAKVEGYELHPEMVLKTANENKVFEGGIELRGLASTFTDQLIDDEHVTYEVGESLNRDRIFSSVAYKKQEETLIERADTLQGRNTKNVSSDFVAQAIKNREEELGFVLSEEQQAAITHLCSGPDIRILNGKAGTGKTTLLKAVSEAYEQAGYQVLGTSFQGKAVEIIEQEVGISCKTLDSFRVAWENYDKQKASIDSGKLWGRAHAYATSRLKELESQQFTDKNVIIVDEANMIGGRLWDVFLKQATDKGAKVLIVQDPAQIKSREPGDYGRLFAERFGVCETSEVVRQRVPWQRECSKLLNEYQVLDGLQPYYGRGHLEWFEGSPQTHQALAQAYVEDFIAHPEKTRIALAYQNVEVYQLNQIIRQGLIEQGHLQESYKINGEDYSVGDRIRFTQNDNHGRFVTNESSHQQSDVKGIKNGSFGTIQSYDETSNTITVVLESNRTVQFNPEEYPHFTHGYAMGIHKSEGSTFDQSFVSLSPLVDPSTLLVAMTRHRDDVKAYINREQFLDFKDLVEKIGRPALKETLQDYQISEGQKPAFNRVQQYRDLTIEAVTLREEMESELDPTTPLYKHVSYPAYQTLIAEKKRVAETILKDWQNHAPYVRLAGIRKDVLEVEVGLRPRLLSDLEHRAGFQVQAYMDLVRETRVLWNTISQTHPGALTRSHALYEDYQKHKGERDSIAAVIQENRRLYAPFFKVTKDDAGELTDAWGEKIEAGNQVYFVGVKSHAAAHHKSQLQTLYYERLTPEKKGHYDVVNAYVQARNEAAALYSHIKQTSAVSMETFHNLQANRDALSFQIVDSPEHYQAFFKILNVKEDKLLTHAVAGELREKVHAYAMEPDISKRASQAQELKRLLTSSSDYRIFKETGLEFNRITFDIAFDDKVKNREIPHTLDPHQVYQPIQNYLKVSKESAQLWKSSQGDANLKKDWEASLQVRHESAQALMANQDAFLMLDGMSKGLQQRVSKHAEHHKSSPSVDSVLEAARGNIAEIAADLLGSPNPHLSGKTALRFGNKGSLVINISGTKSGLWKDFETQEGGNLIHLIQREKKMNFKDALIYLTNKLNILTPQKEAKPMIAIKESPSPQPEDLVDMASRLNAVSELQMKSKPIEWTVAEIYLREERGIHSLLSNDLRYLPKGTTFMYGGECKTLQHNCFAAFGRNQDGRLRSVQLTKLTEDGKRALDFNGDKLNKIQYGVSGGSFVTLQEGKDTGRVFIAEGLETALSLKEAHITGKIVASLGIHNISSYQGPEKEIILCADNDEHKPNSKTHTVLEKAQDHFTAQGHSVALIKPSNPGDDFNDVLKKQGIQGVEAYVKPYLDPEKQQNTSQKSFTRDMTSGHSTSSHSTRNESSSSTSKTHSIGLISDYIQSKLRDIRVYEGTSLAHEAKHELKNYITTLQKNEPLFQELKLQNEDLTKDLERLFREQERVKDRSIGMEM